mmetsp:Transcript_907/g.3824  ORF Transcript_907/g.3824 Transcript_907/m.3824 type:complete len:200 (-) Transcript_907:363-962(-)
MPHTAIVPSSATVATMSRRGCNAAALRNRACDCVSQNTRFVVVDAKLKTPPLSAITTTPLRAASETIGPGLWMEKIFWNEAELMTSHATTNPASFAVTATHCSSTLAVESGGNAPRRESTSLAQSATGTALDAIETSSSVLRNDSPSNSNTNTSPMAVPTSTCALPSREHELHTPRPHMRATPPPSTTTEPSGRAGWFA